MSELIWYNSPVMIEKLTVNVSRRKIYTHRVLEFLPDMMLAVFFLLAWINPAILGGSMISWLRLVLVAELFLLTALAAIYWHISRAFHLMEFVKPVAVIFFCAFY